MQQISLKLDKYDRDGLSKQELAADPQCNVFVSASAGTGKTKVLCDRFINLVLSGASPENIVCVTYTNSAAEEMRERIVSQIAKLREFSDLEVEQYFRSLNKKISKRDIQNVYESILSAQTSLKIQTLHAFCMQILKANRISGNNVEFDIMSRYQQSLLCKNVYDNLLTYSTTHGFKELQNAFELLFCYFSFNEIRNRIVSSLNYAPDIEHRLKELSTEKLFDLHGANQNYDKEVEFRALLNNISPSLREIINTEPELAHLKNAIDSVDIHAYCKFFFTTEKKPRTKLIRKALSLKHPELEMLLSHESSKLCEYCENLKNHVSAIVNLAFSTITKQFLIDYRAAKYAKHLLNYGDLIPMTLDLLSEDQGLLYNLDYKIDHILVDEAQDLSKDQWDLIKALSLEFFSGAGVRDLNRTIFIVGDFKQSIFSFQGARPQLFNDALKYFEQHVTHALKQWRYIEFSLSYRSTKYVLDLVNEIFTERFEGYQLHAPFKSGNGKIAIWDLESRPTKEKNDSWGLPSSEHNENDHKLVLARAIAARINNWIKQRRLISDTDKPVTPSDILILVRKRSEFVDMMSSEISKLGIGVDSIGSKLLVDELLYKDILSLIQFHVYPSDDLNLAGLLKSPFFRVSESELLVLCHKRKGCLLNNIKDINNSIYTKLAKLRGILTSHSPFNAFYKIFLECGYKQEFIRSFGVKAIEKIDYLLCLLEKYESEMKYYNWKELLECLLIEDDKSSAVSESSVKIMTTHSAKGLQAPIVILADAASSRNNQSDKLFTDEYGVHFMLGLEHASSYLKDIAESANKEEEAESLRLLYVAITRAERELYVAGLSNNKEKGSWYDIISGHYKDIWNTQEVYEDSISHVDKEEKENIDIRWLRPMICDISKESFQDVYENKALRYGELVHDILHKKCVLKDDAFESYVNSILTKHIYLLDESDVRDAISESINIVNVHSTIFESDNARSEMPVSVLIDGEVKDLRIDRILFDQDTIIIVDFKTDRGAEHSRLYKKHVAQVKLYERILKSLYSNKKVETYLLWTKNASLEKV
ncbi:MAG: UvrD-helicase domain-containing protein [Alphaproteobacteria bacterium]|jgi:ATP-dependent helicase/nuclease subunit A|nr:UvrD-helicase domain-containing protein [Candidatus Jidaibacter sp.]